VEVILKQRLIGAAVIIALAVVLIPMILDGAGQHQRPLMPEIPKYVSSVKVDPIQVVHKVIPLPNAKLVSPGHYSYFGKDNDVSKAVPRKIPKQDSAKYQSNKNIVLAHGDAAHTEKETKQSTRKAVDDLTLKNKGPRQVNNEVIENFREPKQREQRRHSAKKYQAKRELSKRQAIRNVALAWTVQIASFSSRVNADVLKSKLHKAGFKAYIQKIKNKKKRSIYRVRIGRAANKKLALALLAKVKQEVHMNGYITQFH